MNAAKNPRPVLDPESAHRRQAFWQIYLPLAGGGLVFLGLCVWAALYTAGYSVPDGVFTQQTPAAGLAVIWILLPGCFGSLIQMALVGGVVFLLGKAIGGTPDVFHKLHGLILKGSAALHTLSDKLAAPVIQVGGMKAGWDRLWDLIAFWKQPSRGE
jgi:hypothetical protein